MVFIIFLKKRNGRIYCGIVIISKYKRPEEHDAHSNLITERIREYVCIV